MSKKNIILSVIAAVLVILTIMWCVHIVIKQIDFINGCEEYRRINDYDECDTSFKSYPISNVNGECSCIKIRSRASYKSPTKIKHDVKQDK